MSFLTLRVCGFVSLCFSLFFSTLVLAAPSLEPRLSVGVVEFDPGIPNDVTVHRAQGVFPIIRKAEARYLPYLLRQQLVADERWGVVRIMPGNYQAADVLVQGVIKHSNGQVLGLQILAQDSTGRVWIDKVYSAKAVVLDEPGERQRREPFLAIYRQIATDLAAADALLSPQLRRDISTVSTLRYGMDMLPEFFSEYLQADELGVFAVTRLPAEDDPMLARIKRMQAYEYLFIDTADEQYQSLQADVQKAYDLWREYSREQILYIDDFKRRAALKKSEYRRGSFGAMTQSYGDYQWFRTQEQNQMELALGFDNEVLPTVMKLQDRVVTLDGNLQTQYLQWRDILRSMLKLERGGGP